MDLIKIPFNQIAHKKFIKDLSAKILTGTRPV